MTPEERAELIEPYWTLDMMRSWAWAQRDFNTPHIRARIDAKLAELDASPPAKPMTAKEFMAWVAEIREAP